MKEVYQGLVLVSRERKGHEQSRVGHKEKLDGDRGSVAASANPAGISDTGVTLLNSVELSYTEHLLNTVHVGQVALFPESKPGRGLKVEGFLWAALPVSGEVTPLFPKEDLDCASESLQPRITLSQLKIMAQRRQFSF